MNILIGALDAWSKIYISAGIADDYDSYNLDSTSLSAWSHHD